MSEPFVFDSRCTVCKDPFGAIPCGQTVTFHCRPLASEQFTSCTLVLRHEFAQREEEWEMVLEGPQAERVRYGLTVSVPAEPEPGVVLFPLPAALTAPPASWTEPATAAMEPPFAGR